MESLLIALPVRLQKSDFPVYYCNSYLSVRFSRLLACLTFLIVMVYTNFLTEADFLHQNPVKFIFSNFSIPQDFFYKNQLFWNHPFL